MPVRVKQRAGSYLESDKVDDKEFGLLKRQLVALLLGWQRPVSVIMKAGKVKSARLNIRMSDYTGSHELDRNTNFPFPKSTASAPTRSAETALVCSILSQARYIEPTDWDAWIKASARTSTITAKGAISLAPAPSKQVQFISLGIRPIFSQANHNALYGEINRLFAASNFGNQENNNEVGEDRMLKDKRFKQGGFTNKQLKGAGKGVDRWPMFYIRIELNGMNDIERLERENVLSDVLKVVQAMIQGFLKNNHFRPHPRIKGQARNHQQISKTPCLALCASDVFRSWSRIKRGRQSTDLVDLVSSTSNKAEFASHEGAETPVVYHVPDQSTGSSATGNLPLLAGHEDQMLEWTNPVNKQKVLINSRTGLVVSKPSVDRRPNTAPPSLPSMFQILPCRVTRRLSTPQGLPNAGSWATNLLAKWENPVFASAEESIPRVSLDGPQLEAPEVLHGGGHGYSEAAFAQSCTLSISKLSKKALREAYIISQVDKKFILIRMADETQTLVLVDQHAADERIRIETLIAELGTQAAIILPKPIIFDTSIRDQELLEKHRSYFEHWGIQYKISKSSDSINYNVSVTTLPRAIAERCRIEPKVLLDLLRGEAWKLEDTSTIPAVHTPPQRLLDILNSRACRSAIMFNDVLSIEEARTLISRLAQTQLPFQCAHGRPSMVPLVSLGKPESSDSESIDSGLWKGRCREAEEGFGTTWKRWRKKCEVDDSDER
ncbi:MAG: hypothetical protein Q9164_006729 [Protoblastenia rupestris]